MAQADKMRAKATKTVAAQNMARRAERLLSGLEAERGARQGGQAALPEARAVRQDAAARRAGCRSPTARWRSSPTSTWPSTAARASSCSASTAPARPPCCGCSPASTRPTPARSSPATGCKIGYYAQEHETLDVDRTRAGEHAVGRARPRRDRRAQGARLVPVQRRRRRQAGRGALRRREDPARAGHARRVVGQRAAARRAHQQPRPGLAARRSSARCAPTRAPSCWSPTTRAPSRRSSRSAILLLPDGVEDLWSADYRDLVDLA